MVDRRRVSELFAGAVGGPLVVGVLTPQRNAMTLAAKDVRSSLSGVYRQVYAAGVLQAFRGGSRPACMAVPQFMAVGPVYLWTEQRLHSTAGALFASALVESLFCYGAERRNAQVQYNATQTAASNRIEFQPLHRLVGPGFVPHVGRNAVALMGIRLWSPYSQDVVYCAPGMQAMPEEARLVASDLLASLVSAMMSMPLAHLFSWAACTPELTGMSYLARAEASCRWLTGTYKKQGAQLLARDLVIRVNYSAFLFTGYRLVERNFVRWGTGTEST